MNLSRDCHVRHEVTLSCDTVMLSRQARRMYDSGAIAKYRGRCDRKALKAFPVMPVRRGSILSPTNGEGE